MYTCAITQNKIIELLGYNIRSQIQTQTGGRAFSIIFDKTHDTTLTNRKFVTDKLLKIFIAPPKILVKLRHCV